jgi:hypothetical protein
MKVKIGPYKSWVGPYQIAEALCFWAPKQKDEFGFPGKPDWVHKFGDFLAHGFAPDEDHLPKSRRLFSERPVTWLYKLLQWIDSKKKRQVVIKIDPWDTWNMDGTLSMIILPMLKQLKEKKHGAGHVDDEDVPEHLRSTAAPAKENEYDTDENWFKRMDWVFDEMIWTFEQLQPDYDWEEQYRSGEHDVYMEPCNRDADGKPTMYEMKRGPNDTYKLDMEARQKHQDRISNGLRLFGKYYQSLWD